MYLDKSGVDFKSHFECYCPCFDSTVPCRQNRQHLIFYIKAYKLVIIYPKNIQFTLHLIRTKS